MHTYKRKKNVLAKCLAAAALLQPGIVWAADSVTYPIVDTGQTQCLGLRTAARLCPTKGDATYGQDAQYQGRQPSYEKHADGTVTDRVTGLVWAGTIDTNGDGEITAQDKMTYEQAMAYARTLKLAGHADWRLPSIKELYSLILFDGEDVSPLMRRPGRYDIVPFIAHDVFDFAAGDTKAGERLIDSQYVSRTRYVTTTMRGDPTAFGVNFIDGRIKGYGTSTPHGDKTFYVMPVRGNPKYGKNAFRDQGNGTVRDTATGLTWQKADSKLRLNFKKALSYCETLTLAGKSDWRLPNVKELQSIVDYSRSPETSNSAAIAPVFMATSIQSEAGTWDYGWYWSSTTHKSANGRTAAAAYVAFGRSYGKMRGQWLDVHGAGSQRSDPKSGNARRFRDGRGPQGDAVRIDNLVRCVRSGDTRFVQNPDVIQRAPFTVVVENTPNMNQRRGPNGRMGNGMRRRPGEGMNGRMDDRVGDRMRRPPMEQEGQDREEEQDTSDNSLYN